MNCPAKLVFLSLSLLIFLSGCTDKNNDSPFQDILSRAPYSVLTDSIQKYPKRDELYFRRAILLNKNNLPEPALADFQKAWSLQKDERYALGVSTLLRDKNPDSAIQFLDGALKDLPNSFLLRLNLARGLEALDKTDEALDICNEILLKNPQQVDILKMKADLLVKKDDPEAAIRILESAYQLTPFDLDLNYALAYQYAENKNPKVMGLCDSLIRLDTQNQHAEPYYYKGIYFSNINNKTMALALFNVAITHNYYYLNAYIEKGKVQYDQKKYSDALRTFDLANTISATFPDAYFWMGRCQEALGQKEEAKLNYQRAFALDKTFTEAKEAAEKLVN